MTLEELVKRAAFTSMFAIGLISIVIYILSVFFDFDINFVVQYLLTNPLLSLAGIFLALTLITFSLTFFPLASFFSLKTEQSFYKDSSLEIHSSRHIQSEFDALRSEVKKLYEFKSTAAELTEEDIDEARRIAVQTVISNITAEVSKEIQLKFHLEAIDNLESRSLARLSDVSVVLGSRANLTLRMGVMFCTLGLLSIFTSFFILPPNQTSGNNAWVDIFKSYAPRFTMVIIIEVIGFFFLKLYKSTLSEIRYTQNEITNIEMWLIALHSANTLKSDHAEMVLQPLISTERNNVIDKNQTTVEIEQNRAQADADRSILEAAVSLIHGNEKGSFWRRSP